MYYLQLRVSFVRSRACNAQVPTKVMRLPHGKTEKYNPNSRESAPTKYWVEVEPSLLFDDCDDQVVLDSVKEAIDNLRLGELDEDNFAERAILAALESNKGELKK